MEAPNYINAVQKLNGRVTTLGQSISCSAKKCLLFFKVFKEKKNCMGQECVETFHNLKQFLSSPPLLSSLIEGEVLILYLSITQETVSSVLVQEDKREQSPIYYASQALKGEELNYPPLEKLAFTVLMLANKLRPYFESHTIEVRINYPL